MPSMPARFPPRLKAALFIVALLVGSHSSLAATEPNPPAPGFNLTDSDPRAIAIADEVMATLGGRAAWDNTRYLTWRFFGGRRHVWDKFTGDHRFDDGDLLVLSNLNSEHGRAWEKNQPVTDPTTLAAHLTKARNAWINDAYWLVMPYKLKDSGVTLRYVGTQADTGGRPCDVLELTFRDVGRTPSNKYHIFVSRDTRLVTEWTYWRDAAVDQPRSLGPWTNWQRHGQILLADGRGQRAHTELAVLPAVSAATFTDPAPLDFATLTRSAATP